MLLPELILLSQVGIASQEMLAMIVAPTAPRMTTSQGGTRHMTSNKKATTPKPKSAGLNIALVHTGV